MSHSRWRILGRDKACILRCKKHPVTIRPRMFFSVVPRRLRINPDADSGYVSEIDRTRTTADLRDTAGAQLHIRLVVHRDCVDGSLQLSHVCISREFQRIKTTARQHIGLVDADVSRGP